MRPPTLNILSRMHHFLQAGGPGALLHDFVDIFGQSVEDFENAMLEVMQSHWVNTANNEGGQGFDAATKGDLDKILALYLEALGGTSLLRQLERRDGPDGLLDDTSYRSRMLRIIKLLRDGASHRDGIRTIVAANLGVFGDSPAAISAIEQIDIEEYLPKTYTTERFQQATHSEFTVRNRVPSRIPVEITIEILPGFSNNLFREIHLTHLINEENQQFISRSFSADETQQLEAGDILKIPRNGTPQRMRVTDSDFEDDDNWSIWTDYQSATEGLLLPTGVSRWRISTLVGEYTDNVNATSAYDNQKFEEPALPMSKAIFAATAPVFSITFRYTYFQPGTFRVNIPWNLLKDGTNLDQANNNPRHQIDFITSRIRAAGIWSEVAYHNTFTEVQSLEDEYLGHEENTHDFGETHQIDEGFSILGEAGYDFATFASDDDVIAFKFSADEEPNQPGS